MARLTAKGARTRQRIVETAADQVLARGVGGTSLDDVGRAAGTGRSQLFHYFPDGKRELVRAIVACQGQRVLDAQRPWLDDLASWDSWQNWRDAVIAHYRRVDGVLGCPIGSLSAEVATTDPELRAEIAASFAAWRGLLASGVRRMVAADLIHGVDPDDAAVELLAAIQGGLLLAQSAGDLGPLEIALDGALARLRAATPAA